MAFQVWAKYGCNWSYKGIFRAKDSRSAAKLAQQHTGRNVLKVTPEDSNTGYTYRLRSA